MGVILRRSFAPFCGVDGMSVRCELVEIAMDGFRTKGAGEAGGGSFMGMKAAMANLPFARMMSWGMHSCGLFVAVSRLRRRT